ncbi:MAG: hypothetical protein KC475_04210 [Cyanobacteria bacterium HKST-UBA03]|nr:hypothetical protein [Cyanobacteria bacterium HKST-UBA03]
MSIQSALYRQISTAASRFQPLIKGVNKAIRPLSGPTNIEKAVLDYWELLPAAIPGLYFMYQMGQQLSRDTFIKPTPIRDASTSIGEGLLTKWIVDNTTRVYPAMGVMWGAYRAGMEDNRVNRVKALIEAALLFPMGYLGVQLGQWFTDLTRMWEGYNIHSFFTPNPRGGPMFKFFSTFHGGNEIDSRLGALLAKPSPHLANPDLKALIPLLKRVKDTNVNNVRTLGSLFAGKSPTVQQLANDRKPFEEAVKAFLDHVGKLRPEQLRQMDAALMGHTHTPKPTGLNPAAIRGPLSKFIRQLRRGNAGYRSILRLINPAFGYLILTSFVAIPLVKLISEQLMPRISKEPASAWKVGFQKDMAPIWLDHVLGMGHPKGRMYEFFNQGGTNPFTTQIDQDDVFYGQINGPSLIGPPPLGT